MYVYARVHRRYEYWKAPVSDLNFQYAVVAINAAYDLKFTIFSLCVYEFYTFNFNKNTQYLHVASFNLI